MRTIATITLFSILCITSLTAQTRPSFNDLRQQLESIYTRKQPDGSFKVSKQFRRWEWFWSARTLPDGTLPTAHDYLSAINSVRQNKSSSNPQNVAVWKEVGPFAPDLPSRSAVWNGIGRMNCLAFDHSAPGTMWAGAAQGGIWKTTNDGASWSEVTISDLPHCGISDIVISPSNYNVLYVATGDVHASIPGKLTSFPGFSYGVWKSTDNGKTWNTTSLSRLPEENALVSRLWVDPRNEDIVVAATYAGLQRSTDGGSSWTTTFANVAFRDLIGHPTRPDLLFASSFNFNGNVSVYRSTDNGVTWTVVQTMAEANRIRIAVAASNPAIVGLVASDRRTDGLEGVYFSSDTGKTYTKRIVGQNLLGWDAQGNDWQAGGQGFYDLAMAIDPSNANNWVVGGVNTWRSTNAGMSWVLSSHWVGQGAPWVHADHHYIVFHPTQKRLYDCNDGGIARSTDGGVTWRDISQGLRVQQYYGLSVTDLNSSVTLAGAQDNGTARTTDGASFMHVLDGDGMASAIDAKNPNLMYASQPYGSFFRSTNGGASWRIISRASSRGEPGGSWVAPIAVDPSQTNRVYIGYTRMYRSDNAGDSWQRLGEFGVDGYLRLIAVAPSDGKYLYAAFTNTMFSSSDGGTTWQPIQGVNSFIQAIRVHPTNPRRAFVVFGGFSAQSKVVEIDNGVVKNLTGAGLPNIPVNAVVFQPGPLNRLYVGTDLGVFAKDENSTVWEPYGVGLRPTVVSGMELLPSSSVLRISTYGRGIWEVRAEQCVAQKPTVQVVGQTNICQGDTIRLFLPLGYPVSRWSNGSTDSVLIITTPGQSGEYSATVIDDKGCRATSDPVSITVKRLPTKPLITFRPPDTLRAFISGSNLSYQWFKDGTLIDGANQREYRAVSSGTYTVRVTNDDGCANTSESYTFTQVGTSVSEGGQELPECWPNPTSSVLHVRWPIHDSWSLQLYDVQGQTITTIENRNPENDVLLNLNDLGLARGIYIVQLNSNTAIHSFTVVKR